MAGCSTWAFFSVAGVAHNTHTHIHINRTLANFFADTILATGAILVKLECDFVKVGV